MNGQSLLQKVSCDEYKCIMDPKLIVSWVFVYASKHQLYNVIHSIVRNFEISDLEMIMSDSKQFEYSLFAYLYYVIENIHQKQILENHQVWKTCVDIAEMIFCRSKNIQLIPFTTLLNKFKFMVLLQLLKQEKLEDYRLLIDEYFPIKNMMEMEEKIRIHPTLNLEMRNALVKCRNLINAFVFHFDEFDQHYRYFIRDRLKQFSASLKDGIDDLLRMELDLEETIIEKILNGSFEDEEKDSKDEISLVKRYFHQSEEENSAETCFLRLLAELKI